MFSERILKRQINLYFQISEFNKTENGISFEIPFSVFKTVSITFYVII